MKKLADILKHIKIENLFGNPDIRIAGIEIDSRKVEQGYLFVAMKGTKVDGHDYINHAVKNGAVCVLCQELPQEIRQDVTYVRVESPDYVLGNIVSEFYDHPSQNLKLVGVTGTNGKTTIATQLYRLFELLGYKTGLLSTIQIMVHDQVEKSTLTTPDVITINKNLKKMNDVGCEFCFMEVSSHAVIQNRIAGLHFVGGIFTNITHDHLDYHSTFNAYIKAKQQFFNNLPETAFALTNSDDKNGKIMVQNTKAKIATYGIKSFADYMGQILESHITGLFLQIDNREIWTKLTGNFNAHNLLAVYSVAVMLGQDKQEVLQHISSLENVTGRFETIRSPDGVTAIIDYAHTPDALENVLRSINQVRTGNETFISLVGAGGDRDRTKRPMMAKICAELADKVILTSDNPRTEDPVKIIEDMEKGITLDLKKKATTIVDRKEAIKAACFMANEGDIILIPGKGHEDYQEVNGIRHHFNDREIVEEIFGIKNTKIN